jgi:hypothetical protein
MSGKFFLPLKWYTDRRGGEVAEKNFQVKFKNLVLSGRFNQTPPLKRVSRDGTGSIATVEGSVIAL